MLELLDPKKLDKHIYDEGMLDEIRPYSLLDGKRLGWHYCLDYVWMALKCRDILKPGMRVIDIGCGPGAIHGYLEEKYGVDIFGVDTQRWDKDYVDAVGNFTDPAFHEKYGFGPESVDLIISISAVEHNPPKEHQRIIDVALETLKPGGSFLFTMAASPFITRRYKSSFQWNLPRRVIEKMYGDTFEEYDYWKVWKNWRNHREIPENYSKRHKSWGKLDPPFLVAGAHIVKKS